MKPPSASGRSSRVRLVPLAPERDHHRREHQHHEVVEQMPEIDERHEEAPICHRAQSLPRKIPIVTITGLLLAGGQGRRMGGVDKGLQLLRGKPMAQWALERLAPQVDEVLINCNQNLGGLRALRPPRRARRDRRLRRPARRAARRAQGGGASARGHGALRFAVPAVRIWSHGSQSQLAGNTISRSRRPATSRTRCSRSCAATSLQNLEAFLRSGGRKIDAWYASLRTRRSELRRRSRRVPQHQHPRRAEPDEK